MVREAACRTHGNESNDAMNAFHNAAKSYKKTNPEGQLINPFVVLELMTSGRISITSSYQVVDKRW